MGLAARMIPELAHGTAALSPPREQRTADAVPWPEIVALVRRTVRRIVGPGHDVEDLTQTALERVVAGMDRFEGRARIETFVYRVAVNVALNHWRWWRRFLRRFDPTAGASSEEDVEVDAPGPFASLADARRAERVRAVLEKLAPEKRIVIVLADFEELTAFEIAEILGCAEPTVRSRLRLARAKLAELVLADPVLSEEVQP